MQLGMWRVVLWHPRRSAAPRAAGRWTHGLLRRRAAHWVLGPAASCGSLHARWPAVVTRCEVNAYDGAIARPGAARAKLERVVV